MSIIFKTKATHNVIKKIVVKISLEKGSSFNKGFKKNKKPLNKIAYITIFKKLYLSLTFLKYLIFLTCILLYHKKTRTNVLVISLMGRNKGIEPLHTGATIRRVNHFTNTAISKYINILSINCTFCKTFLRFLHVRLFQLTIFT